MLSYLESFTRNLLSLDNNIPIISSKETIEQIPTSCTPVMAETILPRLPLFVTCDVGTVTWEPGAKCGNLKLGQHDRLQ